MADPHNTKGAPPTHVHVEKNKQPGWFKALAWIALIAGILALLLGLSRLQPRRHRRGHACSNGDSLGGSSRGCGEHARREQRHRTGGHFGAGRLPCRQ